MEPISCNHQAEGSQSTNLSLNFFFLNVESIVCLLISSFVDGCHAWLQVLNKLDIL